MKACRKFWVLAGMWMACAIAVASGPTVTTMNGVIQEFEDGENGSAIDQAITYFNSTTSGYVTLKIPAGEFVITQQIIPPPHSSIIGDSDMTSFLIGSDSMNSVDLVKVNGDCVGISLIGFSRETNMRNNVTGNGINCNGHTAVGINRVSIRKQNIGITSKDSLGALSDVYQLALGRVVITYTKAQAVLLKGADIDISDCLFQYIGNTAIDLQVRGYDPASNQPMAKIHDSTLRLACGKGISIEGIGTGTPEGNKVNISNMVIDKVYESGIQLTSCRQVIISKNMIRGCGTNITLPTSGNFEDSPQNPGWSNTLAYLGCAIYIPESNSHITIDSNILTNNGYGVRMENLYYADGPTNVIISNNQIYNTTLAGGCGIEAWGSYSDWPPNYYIKYVTITGNQIHGFADSGYQTVNNCEKFIYANNIVYGNTYDISGGAEGVSANNIPQ